jgi:hypothetical protein
MDGADTLTAQVNLAPVATLGQSPAPEVVFERMAQNQALIIKELERLQHKEQPINVSVNPEIRMETPELRMNMDITKADTKSARTIKLVRDDKGNLIGAESSEK